MTAQPVGSQDCQDSMSPAATKGSSLGVALLGLHLYSGYIKLKKFFPA